MDEAETISNVKKATKQELMDGYRILLKKYQGLLGETTADEHEQTFTVEKKYKNLSDINESINAVRASLHAALAGLETSFEEKFIELKKFDEATEAQRAKLREQYEIETTASALFALLAAKDEVKRQADNEKTETDQKRKRDEEEYRFNFELLKRKDKETFEAEKRQRDIEAQLAENLLAEKEKTFANREKVFVELEKQVAEFPAKLEAEKQRAAATTKAECDRNMQASMLLLQKTTEAQVTVLEGKVAASESIAEEQKLAIASLHAQLKASQAQVQEVVLKSIEGASNIKALDAVNKLALEQSRSTGQR
jgi:hypothetical protein